MNSRFYVLFGILLFLSQQGLQSQSLPSQSPIAADSTKPKKSPPGPEPRWRWAPYDRLSQYNTISIKGKLLPWPMGNGLGISGFLGAEYGFSKTQSIGIDGFFQYFQDAGDNETDTAGVKHDNGNYSHSIEKAFMIDYRFYLDQRKLRNKGLIPYIMVMFRYGTIYSHHDPLYPINEFFERWEIHRSLNLMLGVSGRFSHETHWGWDLNIGGFIKDKTISSTYTVQPNAPIDHKKSTVFGPRLSANIIYSFPRSNHTEHKPKKKKTTPLPAPWKHSSSPQHQ